MKSWTINMRHHLRRQLIISMEKACILVLKAKALAEKNMRDILVQREHAEKHRLLNFLILKSRDGQMEKKEMCEHCCPHCNIGPFFEFDFNYWNQTPVQSCIFSSSGQILGSDSGWQAVPLTDLITTASVKKAYRKATLCVHPDKVQQRGATIRQKYICEKVFDLLKVCSLLILLYKLVTYLQLLKFQYLCLRSTLGRWLMVPFVLQKQCNMNLLKIGESEQRLGNSIGSAMGNAKCISVEEVWEDMNITVFASKIDGEVLLKSNRPALVSSTSWSALLNHAVIDIAFFVTPDEDFSILLEAVLMYDRCVAAALGEDDSTDEEQLWIDIKNGKQFVYPRLLFIVTGKGPDRKKYEDQIKRLKLRRVALWTMWLASEDYPLLLGMPADFTSVCTLVAQNLPNLMGTRA
ncbi:UDP-glycosyltransferase TURAN [Zea mays]|uniref:UDP-glycosyltransferase TURAN n=1 Tax=Zea mays TaxID=4577 RepID=A0A1D6Q2L3_MAIZE|nr:UDP-glycosyltransferase TURAN [Zea mays]